MAPRGDDTSEGRRLLRRPRVAVPPEQRSEDFIGRFNERFQALAASQDLLVRNTWQGADVVDLIPAGAFCRSRRVSDRGRRPEPTYERNRRPSYRRRIAIGKYGPLSVDIATSAYAGGSKMISS